MSIRSVHAPLAVVGGEVRPARGAGWLRQAARMVAAWHERARQRRDLRSLDARLLKDLGLSRADVDLEARKTFWHP